MKRTREGTRLPEVLDDKRVRRYISGIYDAQYASVAIARWKKGPQYPPVWMLAEMAKIIGGNIDYILGRTDIKALIESTPEREKTLDELQAISGLTDTELRRSLNSDSAMVLRYRKKLPINRVTSLIALSDALGLSIDFILGYTEWETWELCGKLMSPFMDIPSGSAAFVIVKGVKTKKDIYDAIKDRDGQFCLVSSDGKEVIFPTGETISIDDELLEGSYAVKVKPEV